MLHKDLRQGHISEEELDIYLAELSHRQAQAELAETTRAWLAALRQCVPEVEEDTPEAFRVRRQLARLLVTAVRTTYRFGSPPGKTYPAEAGGVDSSVGSLMNGSRS